MMRLIIILLMTISTIATYAQDRPLVDFLLTLRAQNNPQANTPQPSALTGSQSGQNLSSSGSQTPVPLPSSAQWDCDADFGDIDNHPFRQSILYVTGHCLMFHTIREWAFFPSNHLRRHDVRQTIQRLLARQIVTIHNETTIQALLTRRRITEADRRRLLGLNRVLGSERLDQKDELVTRRDAKRLVGLLTLMIPGFDSSWLSILDSSTNPYVTRGEWAFILGRLYRSWPHSIIVNLEQPQSNLDHLFRAHSSAPSASHQTQQPKPTKQTPEQVMVASAQSLWLRTITPELLDKPIPPRDFLALVVLANHKANPHIPAYSDNPRYRNNETMALLDQAKNLWLTRVWSWANIEQIYQSSGFVSPGMAAELVAKQSSDESWVITYRQALMTILSEYNIVPTHQLITRRTPAQRIKTLLR